MRVVVTILFLCFCNYSSLTASRSAKGRVIGLFHPDQVARFRDTVEAIPEISIEKLDFQTSVATIAYSEKLLYQGDLKKTRESIDRILRGESMGMFEFLPCVEEGTKNWKEVLVPIAGLDCMACSYAAYLAVCKIEGVCRATADFGTGKLKVWILEDKVSLQRLHEELVKRRIPTDYSLNYETLVPRQDLSVVRVSSEGSHQDGRAANLIDGDSQSIWQSQFTELRADLPHEIVLDLGKSRRVKAVHYLPRQDPSNVGLLAKTEFHISEDKAKFPVGPQARILFGSLKSPQAALFDAPKKGRYLLIRILGEINGKPDVSIAELGVEELP